MTISQKIAMTLALTATFAWGCDNSDNSKAKASGAGNDAGAPGSDAGAKADAGTADFEFDVVTFTVSGGPQKKVRVNGLPLEEMAGADKVSGTQWETTTRQGVRFSEILKRAKITADDDTPVNCVARDNFDPLRTKLQNDTAKLPHFDFFRDNAYVYVGSPGDKDPLYPDMEGKSLIVDYDVKSDAEVPAYLGGTIASLGMFRWKMIEEVAAESVRGVIEIDPVIQ